MTDTQMIEHDCPIEGQMMIEAGKPCNWCGELDDAKVDMSDTPMPRPEEPPDGWIMHPHVREWRMYALALAARIERVERELADARHQQNLMGAFAETQRNEYEAALAERDAEIARLREDAERYKKIKTHPDHQFRISNQLGETVISCKIAVLDSVIDSVRKTE